MCVRLLGSDHPSYDLSRVCVCPLWAAPSRVPGRGLAPAGWLWSQACCRTPTPAHRRNKVLNHFSIMQQRRLKDQDQDEEDEEKEKRGRKKASELRIHDLEDDLEMSSDDSEASGEEGEPRRSAPWWLGWSAQPPELCLGLNL